MNFFFPGIDSIESAEKFWLATKQFAEETLRWKVTNRRIFSIQYTHNRQNMYAEVGKPETPNGELVLVILESNAYLVCTISRGVKRGMPFLVGREEAWDVKYFDDYQNE
jgi:hypothetical protein